MKKSGSISGYFTEGFALLNKSLEVFLVALIFFFISSINSFILIPKLPWPEVLSNLLFITANLIGIGFSLSIPVFLLEKQRGKALNLNKMFSTTLQNTKRIILPAILILIFFVILLIVVGAVILTTLKPTNEQITQFFQSPGNRWNPFFFLLLILPIISSFLVFAPFLFSLEHKGLLVSIKGSITTSLKHLPYITAVIAAGIIPYLLINFLPTSESWALFLGGAITTYIDLVVIASTLFYYQKVIKKEIA